MSVALLQEIRSSSSAGIEGRLPVSRIEMGRRIVRFHKNKLVPLFFFFFDPGISKKFQVLETHRLEVNTELSVCVLPQIANVIMSGVLKNCLPMINLILIVAQAGIQDSTAHELPSQG